MSEPQYYRGRPLPEGMSLGPPGSDRQLPELTIEEIESTGIVDGIDLSKPESEQDDFVKALLNVEYDEDDTPAKLAERSKNKGNTMYKRGSEYFGNALRHYKDCVRHSMKVAKPTEETKQVHSIALSNSAAIHLARKQWDKVTDACEKALNLWPGNVKACFRAGKAHSVSGSLAKAQEYTRRGLALEPKNKALKKLLRLIKKKLDVLEERKAAAAAAARALQMKRIQLREACEERHIVVGLPIYDAPSSHNSAVVVDQEGIMHWPCMFLYDEYSTSDFVAQFSEMNTFRQQLEVMLPDRGESAPWDKDGAYRVSNVDVYYVERATVALPPHLTFLSEGDPALLECKEAAEENQKHPDDLLWVKVPMDAPLLLALCQKHHIIPRYPVFHVVARNRAYYREFYKKRRGKIVKLKMPST